MGHRRIAVLLLVVAVAPLRAQQGSTYVPLQYWGAPYVEHLIARGVMVDPTPLTRPFDRVTLVRALREADTTVLSVAERAAVRRIVDDLTRNEAGPWGRVDADLGVAAASHPLRDPLEIDRGAPPPPAPRSAGAVRGFVNGGVGLQLLFGPVAVVTHPYFDTRLKFDPDYEGKKDRAIAGRNAEAYVRGTWRYGEIFFGSVDRNWGPAPTSGLIVSPSPYSYDHFAFSIGTNGLRLEGLITQLDDINDTADTAEHRYFVAHRLLVHPPGHTTIALWEGEIIAGPGRQLEPWYANILNLGLLAQYDRGSPSNSLVGVDVTTRVLHTRTFASLLIDDFQIDRGTASDKEPPAYGLTIGAEGGLGAAAWTAFYTRVTNLTYRTPNPAEAVMDRGDGLGRNFSDYDQVTIRGSVIAGPGLLLSPEATLLRQGQGDFRLPYPAVAAYASTPTFLAGVVERTLRLALGANLDRASWGLAANGGVHLEHNAGHVSGASRTRWIGSVAFTYRFHRESPLP